MMWILRLPAILTQIMTSLGCIAVGEHLDFKHNQGQRIRSKAKLIEAHEQLSQFFVHKGKKSAVKKSYQALRTDDGRRLNGSNRHQFRVPTDKAAQNRLLGLLD